MKVSRAGYDVKTCSDNQLLWSSAFRSPLVIYSGTYSGDGNPHDIYTHNLGFWPVCLVFIKASSSRMQFTSSFGIYKNKIADLGNGVAYTFTYFILNMDLTADYSAPSLITTDATQSSTPQDYGWKVSKDGQDVKSATLDNLASSSGLSSGGYPIRQQLIHKIGGITNQTTNTTQSIAHGLGYPAMYYLYMQEDSGDNRYFQPRMLRYEIGGGPEFLIQATVRTWMDGTNLNVFHDLGSDKSWRYVIFKDPLL